MPKLYPPHPSSRIPSHELHSYESSGEWFAQRKFNGTHILIHISPSGKVGMLTRHGTPPKLFSLSESHVNQILALNLERGKEYWLAGELLDHKTKDSRYKGKIVLFDVLQAGRYFIRSPDQVGRLTILSEICGHPSSLEPARGIALAISEDLWMAETWADSFSERFSDFLDMDEVEGLVLRKKSSVLESFGQKPYDVHWIVRCRKPDRGKSYLF